MSELGALAAIERIERALARVEAAFAQPGPPPANDLALAELAARHQTLREETRNAIAEIDTMIAELQNG